MKLLLMLLLQVYYPHNNTVITVSSKLPQEEDSFDSLYSSQMVSYDNGNKLGTYLNNYSTVSIPKS